MAKTKTNPAEENVQTPEQPAVETPVDAAGGDTNAAPAAEAPVPSKRDNFRSRVSQRYPDLNMEDEDAYYDQMGGMMDEYEGYEKNAERLRGTMQKTPAFAEMLLAAREQEDFDPVVWMVENRGLDLEEAMNDPEYADKIVKARAEYVAKEAKGREAQEEIKTNLPNTLEATRSALEAEGMGDKFEEIVGQIFQTADDISHGKWDPQIAVMIAKGQNFDQAVADSREEGMAEGLNTKIDDKLRKLDNKKERVSGVQTPQQPVEPKKKPANMFLA